MSDAVKCPVCRRLKSQHSMLEFCPDPSSPEHAIRVYTITKNVDRYPGIGWEFPESFHVAGLNLRQARILADRLTNYEAGCDYAYFCEEDPTLKD